ncbi:hypothetical protein LGN35_24145 [Burkholderia multivorans]|nr:hypothetical protein [Burkholderia multivorans]
MPGKLTDEHIEAAKAAGFYWHPVQKCLCTRHSSGAWVGVDDMLARFVDLLAPTQQPSAEVTADEFRALLQLETAIRHDREMFEGTSDEDNPMGSLVTAALSAIDAARAQGGEKS